MSGLRVAVVGGGLGGLCLAQGLLRAFGGGAQVTVYERDASLAETGARHNKPMFWPYRRLSGPTA
jgi:2-polyprenyl-6-methoxyphenol hydroxylase-like FAD-dependent oxidoreductase